MSIVEHPAYAFQQKIAAAGEVSATIVFKWFKEAHENGFSRRPITDLVLANDSRLRPSWENFGPDLVSWCRARSFSHDQGEHSQSVPVGMGAAFDALIDPAPFTRWLRRTFASTEDGTTSEPAELFEAEDADECEEQARAAFRALSTPDQKTFAKWALDRARWAEEFKGDEISSLMEHIVSNVVAANEAHKQFESSLEELEEIGHSKGYWLFWPAWEVEGAIWDEAFGEDDPAVVVSFYLKSFFNAQTEIHEPSTANAKTHVRLTADDEAVLSWLFDAAAELLSAVSHYNPKGATASQIRRALLLQAGGPLPDWLYPEDRDFSQVVARLPPDLAGTAINSWTRYFPSDPEHLKAEPWHDNDEENKNFAEKEANFVVRTILAHIDSVNYSMNDVPDLPDGLMIDYEELFATLSQLEDSSVDTNSLQVELAENIIAHRDSFFEGYFPFSLRDAEKIFESLRNQSESHWLSHMPSIHFQQTKYGVRRPEAYEGALDTVEQHTRKRATARFEAYRTALDQMRAEHLDELAVAWWAFFIATQSIAFGSMALPAKETRQVAKTAEAMLPNSMMLCALQFANGVANKNSTLDARLTTSAFRSILSFDSNADDNEINAIALGGSRASIERFLIAQITTAVWNDLQTQSRDRLVEAEGYWSRSYFEAGAVRNDWWSPVSALGGALEIEMRVTFDPILRRAYELNLDPFKSLDPFPKELTIGSILKGIENAHRYAKSQKIDIGDMRLTLEQSFEILRRVSFMRDLRNKAAHGRKDTVTFAEFIKARDVIISSSFLSELLKLKG